MVQEKDKEVDANWPHREMVGGNQHKVKCNGCHKVLNGGTCQLKCPVGHLSKDLNGCPNVPTKVSQVMLAHLQITAKEKKRKREHHRISKIGLYNEDNSDDHKNDNIRELTRKMRVSKESYLQERAHLDELRGGASVSR